MISYLLYISVLEMVYLHMLCQLLCFPGLFLNYDYKYGFNRFGMVCSWYGMETYMYHRKCGAMAMKIYSGGVGASFHVPLSSHLWALAHLCFQFGACSPFFNFVLSRFSGPFYVNTLFWCWWAPYPFQCCWTFLRGLVLITLISEWLRSPLCRISRFPTSCRLVYNWCPRVLLVRQSLLPLQYCSG